MKETDTDGDLERESTEASAEEINTSKAALSTDHVSVQANLIETSL